MHFIEKKAQAGTSEVPTAEQSNHLLKWINLNVFMHKKFNKL